MSDDYIQMKNEENFPTNEEPESDISLLIKEQDGDYDFTIWYDQFDENKRDVFLMINNMTISLPEEKFYKLYQLLKKAVQGLIDEE
jgi:hypothetical protein